MPQFARIFELQLISDDEYLLRLGQETRTGTLYYLGIDPESSEHDCGPEQGLRTLFTAWLNQLIQRPGALAGPCYLPFDFGDESTQWLACEIADNSIHTVFGWAPVEGWAISPSNLSPHFQHLPEFSPAEPAFVQTFYLPRLLGDLRRAVSSTIPIRLVADQHD